MRVNQMAYARVVYGHTLCIQETRADRTHKRRDCEVVFAGFDERTVAADRGTLERRRAEVKLQLRVLSVTIDNSHSIHISTPAAVPR